MFFYTVINTMKIKKDKAATRVRLVWPFLILFQALGHQPQKRLSEFVFCVDEFGLPKNVNVLKTSKLTQLRVYKESLA